MRVEGPAYTDLAGGVSRCAQCVPAALMGDHGLAAKLHVSGPT